jgi:pimeloyl-ACP methyl ester carboxylesterase
MNKVFVIIFFCSIRVFAQNHSLISPPASEYAKRNNEKYNTRNYINPYLHNIFMANNRAETGEFRIGLENFSKLSGGKIQLIDLLGSVEVPWYDLSEADFKLVQQYHSIAAINTENLKNPNASIIVIFSSASHNLLSTLALDVMPYLTQKGFIVVMMEYPGYGGSLGEPGRENWSKATIGLLTYLKEKLNRKIYLVGHSIGSAVALEAASLKPDLVSGVVSHAGFYSLREASKDSAKLPSWVNNTIVPILTKVFAKEHLWDNEVTLKQLAINKTPVYFLQGKKDQSVSPRHLALFQNEAAILKKQYPDFKVYSQSFANASHEDLYVNDTYGPFNEMWKSIINFINSN